MKLFLQTKVKANKSSNWIALFENISTFFSILDGWWPEGFNGRNGWAFGGETIEETGLKRKRGHYAVDF